MTNSSLEAYRQNSANSRDQLVEDNLDFVAKILATIAAAYGDSDTRDMLNSAGIVGLIEAANEYDPAKGVAFRTFAFPRIRGAIIDELRSLSPVSKRVFSIVKRIRSACENLESPALPEAIATNSGLTMDEVQEGLEAMRFLNPTAWDEQSFAVPDTNRGSVGDAFEAAEMKELLAEAIESLPRSERLAITLNYLEEMNLAEIAAVMDLSVSRVSRILTSARYRIKEIITCKCT